jgi:small subunit ribosomal protein S1
MIIIRLESVGMSEVKNQTESMADYMDQIDDSMRRLNLGDIVKGRVISVTADALLVDIKFRADGTVKKEDIMEQGELSDLFAEGDIIDVQIVKMDDGEGNVVLSKKRADRVVVWEEIEAAFKDRTIMSVVLKEAVKGGLVAMIKGVRAFLPASQLSLSFVEDLTAYVGQTVEVHVIEFNQENNKVILSRRDILKEAALKAKEEAFGKIEEGSVLNGTVKRLAKFGAFVDIGGVDGLIHISEMSWRRVKDPSEVVKVGDKVEVVVTKIDRENEKIGLKLTTVEENPWDTILDRYEENEIVDGVVVRLADFGAFVKLEDHVEGLVHVSQISEEKVEKPSDVLELGQEVEVLILSIDASDQKISLSIKQIEEEPEEIEMPEEEEEVTPVLGDLFGDKLKDLFK